MPGDLYYGDNLDVLRNKVASESVDLVYLDPPFNSDRTYNLTHKDSQAQQQAFVDTWHWEDSAERAFAELTGQAPQGVRVPQALADMMRALKEFLWEDHRDTLAYLSMMAIRLIEMHRILRKSGCLYLHCDPTASHYLKVILDAIFGAGKFANEIIWQRTNARTATDRWPRMHDTLLFYFKTDKPTFNRLRVAADPGKLPHTLITGAGGKKYQTFELTAPNLRYGETGDAWRGFQPATMGRCWANPPSVMDQWDKQGLIHWPQKKGAWPRRRAAEPFDPESRTVTVGDVWTDIDRINQSANERVGFPTQKPLALLKRILGASSAEGDLVLDPFCGCGTTIEAAEKLNRKWIGIDIAIRAIDVIKDRLDEKFEPRVWTEYGEPSDVDAAAHLADTNPYDFQWWAVRKLGAQPPKGEKKKGGDGGIDGEMTLRDFTSNAQRRVIISVKAGRVLTPEMVKGLESTVRLEKADCGILVTMHQPTAGMRALAREFGPISGSQMRDGKIEHRIRIVTAPEILAGTVRLPGINITPRSQSSPPPAEPRPGENLQLPFPAQASVKKAKPRARGPGIKSVPVVEKVLRVAERTKAHSKKR